MTDNTSQSTELQLLRQEVKALAEEVRKTNHLITGNGTPEHGMVVRLDRVEQQHKVISRISWTAASAVVGLIIHAAWNFFADAKGGSH